MVRYKPTGSVKVRQKILLETEYGIEDYGIKEIEILLSKTEDSSLEENNYPPEIFDKVLDQVPKKLKEDINPHQETVDIKLKEEQIDIEWNRLSNAIQEAAKNTYLGPKQRRQILVAKKSFRSANIIKS
ncbi:14356_t:CDS:2 [Gigaspora margarita]|uniref:14356_t:CDS:1 n=1 Tax=Gigaspora margarita TaxID=4874 RepID=A0ABN7UYE8_GIGMA|nr:14356_t:CDS:2 [Gigaspora margarita]